VGLALATIYLKFKRDCFYPKPEASQQPIEWVSPFKSP